MRSTCDEAARLAAIGLAVFPVRPGRKEPALRDWQARATTSPTEALTLFGAHPSCNVGVVTGAPSGVFVLDVDRKAVDGLTTLAELEERCSQLPATWHTETPSGGLHLWFAYPESRSVSNRAGCAPGLDIRGAGGFVVAPPSIVGGRPYRWVSPPDREALSEAPQWLLDLAAPPAPPARQCPPVRLPGGAGGRLARYVAAALLGEAERVQRAPLGERNQTLFKAAARLGELVGAGVLSHELAVRMLTGAASACGLTGDDGLHAVTATICSGLRRGSENPREVAA
jgi:hypothetical protein